MGGSPEVRWLRMRMALPVVVALAAVAGVGWTVIHRLCDASEDALGRAAARGGADALGDLVGTSSAELGATLGSLEVNDVLTAAVAARDARRILAVAGPLFHDLRTHHGLTHWNYWEPEAPGSVARGLRNVLRLGTPTRRGDLVERETLARAVQQKALVYGIELGYTGFVLRAVAPLRERGRLVGYAELGRNVDLLLAELGRRTGDRYAVALDKGELDPYRWASARAAAGERNDWTDHEHVVLAGNPAHAESLPDVPLASLALSDAAGLRFHAEGRRTFARGVFPLHDVSGRRVGAVFVFRDVTELARDAAALRRRALLELALAVVLAGVAVALVLEATVVRARRSPSPGAPVS